MAKDKTPPKIKQIQNHKPQEINYAYHKTISYSQISMYMQCPKKWALQYKDGHKVFTSSINTVFGNAIHETIQHYISELYNKNGAEADRINLEEYFEERFRAIYLEEYKSNNNTHFTNSEEMREFFDDGVAILDFIKKKRGEYFGKRGWHLVGIELPIILPPDKRYNNVLFNGYIDLVLYHEPTEKFIIYDIKTSTRGWSDREKKDELKQLQILVYKNYFSEQFGVPKENIDVEFFIVKRKIWEESEFPQKRVQIFSPANGKTKTNKATSLVTQFLEETFDFNGKYKQIDHQAKPDKYSCTYCPFKYRIDLCEKSVFS